MHESVLERREHVTEQRAYPATLGEPVMLIYLCTPYSRYRLGRDLAFQHALAMTVRLMQHKIPVWSPIVYSHQFVAEGFPIEAVHWEFLDKEMVHACTHCLVYMLEGWDKSEGITREIAWFKEQGKLIWYFAPGDPIDDLLETIKIAFPNL